MHPEIEKRIREEPPFPDTSFDPDTLLKEWARRLYKDAPVDALEAVCRVLDFVRERGFIQSTEFKIVARAKEILEETYGWEYGSNQDG